MKDGDIYRWRWKNEKLDSYGSLYSAYHCWSQIAEVREGVLYDTYWHDNNKMVSRDDVELTLLGNKHEMSVIRKYDIAYYRPVDVVDTRHRNNTNAPIYLKEGASRNAEVMRIFLEGRIAKARSEIEFAQRRIEQSQADLEAIENGKLTDVHF